MLTISIYNASLISLAFLLIVCYGVYKSWTIRYNKGYVAGRQTAIIELLDEMKTAGYIDYEYDTNTNTYTIKYSDLVVLLNHYRTIVAKIQEYS